MGGRNRRPRVALIVYFAALPCTAPPPPQDFLLPSSRDRPFRAQPVNSSAPQLPCSSAPLPVKPAKDCLSQCFCSLSPYTCRVASWNQTHTTCQSLTTSTLGYRTSLVGAAAPSSHISRAEYTHSHCHEHDDEYSVHAGTHTGPRRVHQRSLHGQPDLDSSRAVPAWVFVFFLSIQSPPSLLSSPPYQLPALATARRLWPSSWYTTRA